MPAHAPGYRLRIALQIAAIMTAVASSAAAPTAEQGAILRTRATVGEDYRITVTKAERVTNSDGSFTGVDLAFTYEFQGRDSVELEGLGKVPAKGDFAYIAKDNSLVFKVSPKATPIEIKVPTDRPPEGSARDFLDLSDFPKNGFEEVRAVAANFPQAISKIFNGEFVHGYRVEVKENRTWFVTGFRDLVGAPKHLEAQIAVAISYAEGASNPPIPFQLRYYVRQRPRLSREWADHKLDQISDAVQTWTVSLLAKLKTE